MSKSYHTLAQNGTMGRMGILVKQDQERSKLQEKIAAELREKTRQTSLAKAEGPDLVNDSVYQENTRQTRNVAWAYMILLGVIIASVVFIFIRF
jgi:hypothetical protein